MNIILNKLKENLDDDSIKTIDVIYKRILNYPEFSYKQILIPNNENIIGGLLKEEKVIFKPKKIKKLYGITLRTNLISTSVFNFFHGLTYLPQKVQEYIENKDFIDIGAYIGDSAIALKRYNYKKIYSIEISRASIKEYKRNMKLNSISENRYKIINCAISQKDGLPPIKIIDSGSAGLSLKRTITSRADEILVEQKTLSKIITENNISPCFIKMDIEGFAMECLQGGIDSIIKYRPVLSIAIYHNPIEFFEIKPYLQSKLTNYTFLIRKLSNKIINNHCHSEIIIIAYPNEREK
ncbi:MAG: FkbM family methyltransferase [Ignavibacteriales bacterium]|nr:FkbM family methyltransferase [Ignavibacteriales bacterium]MCB9258884.1 FkbM family methyltransferase [Ignavibacteriales bacterium]